MTSPEAIQALTTATEALTKIRDHEKACADRWATVKIFMVGIFGALVTMTGTLIYDKFF